MEGHEEEPQEKQTNETNRNYRLRLEPNHKQPKGQSEKSQRSSLTYPTQCVWISQMPMINTYTLPLLGMEMDVGQLVEELEVVMP